MMIPFLLFVIFTPFGQQIYVGGFHFFADRILILFGCMRMAGTKMASDEDIVPWGLNPIDKMFIASTIFGAIATVLVFMQMSAVPSQLGVLWDAIGGYFLIRFMIQNEEDVARFIKILAGSMAILAGTMLNEVYRHQNVFGFITGGWGVTEREGAIRAQGPLAGPILAGMFGATAFCLFVWLWKSGKSKAFAVVGIIACTVITVTSHSSTSLLGYLASLIGLSMWFLRKQMRLIRWGIVILIISLHLVMKAPVWFIITHVDLVAGNSGFHRAKVIDDLVRTFGDWWLIGVKSTNSLGWDMWDQANQFVGAGENGGLITLVCFILMISRSFGRLGTARKIADGDTKKEWELYLLGVVLFSYVVSFFGISFSRGAEVYPWYALFAMIAVISSPLLQTVAVPDLNATPAKAPYRFKQVPQTISTRNQTTP